jgi:hypothetical protein
MIKSFLPGALLAVLTLLGSSVFGDDKIVIDGKVYRYVGTEQEIANAKRLKEVIAAENKAWDDYESGRVVLTPMQQAENVRSQQEAIDRLIQYAPTYIIGVPKAKLKRSLLPLAPMPLAPLVPLTPGYLIKY